MGPGEMALERAHALNELGRHEQALMVCRTALTQRPDDADILVQTGFSLFSLDRAAEAVTTLRAAGSSRPDDPYLQRLLSAALVREGDTVAALDHARRAVELDPTSHVAHLAVAVAAAAGGDPARARASAETAVRMAPDDPITHLVLSEVLVPPGRKPSRRARKLAEQHVRTVLRLSPGDPRALAELSRVAIVSGRRVDAAARLSAALRADPANPALAQAVDGFLVGMANFVFGITVLVWAIGVRVLWTNGRPLEPGFVVFLAVLVFLTVGIVLLLLRRKVPRDVRRTLVRSFVRRKRIRLVYPTGLAVALVLWVASTVASGGLSSLLYLAGGAPVLAALGLAVKETLDAEKRDAQKGDTQVS